MAVFPDLVRPYQLLTPPQVFISQYNLSSRPPVTITPGQNGNGVVASPLQTGTATYHLEITYYCDMAAVEQSQ
jgi:hypothetical protein